MKAFTHTFPGKRVLVVEDYELNQGMVKKLLEMMECEVDIADTGARAIELCQQHAFDLIFMDIQLPEMDGYEATQHIRSQDSGGKRIPIIALTANVMDADKEKCLQVGMDDFIGKPIRGEILEEILSKHLAMAA